MLKKKTLFQLIYVKLWNLSKKIEWKIRRLYYFTLYNYTIYTSGLSFHDLVCCSKCCPLKHKHCGPLNDHKYPINIFSIINSGSIYLHVINPVGVLS